MKVRILRPVQCFIPSADPCTSLAVLASSVASSSHYRCHDLQTTGCLICARGHTSYRSKAVGPLSLRNKVATYLSKELDQGSQAFPLVLEHVHHEGLSPGPKQSGPLQSEARVWLESGTRLRGPIQTLPTKTRRISTAPKPPLHDSNPRHVERRAASNETLISPLTSKPGADA